MKRTIRMYFLTLGCLLCLCVFFADAGEVGGDAPVLFALEALDVERAYVSMESCYAFAGVVLQPEAAERFRELTARHSGGRIGVFMDGRMVALATVQGEIDSGRITVGRFTSTAAAEAHLRAFLPPETAMRSAPNADTLPTDNDHTCPQVFTITRSMIAGTAITPWGELFILTAALDSTSHSKLADLRDAHGPGAIDFAVDGLLLHRPAPPQSAAVDAHGAENGIPLGVFTTKTTAATAAAAWTNRPQ